MFVNAELEDQTNPLNDSLGNNSEQLDESNQSVHNEDAIFIVSNEMEEFKTPHQLAFNAALWITPIWFLTNLMYNYSLYWTSVSSSTIIRLVLN